MKLTLLKPLTLLQRPKSVSFPTWVTRFRLGAGAPQFLKKIVDIGFLPEMDDYEKRKLRIFNQLNFFELVTGVLIPILGLVQNHKLPLSIWLIASIPAFV